MPIVYLVHKVNGQAIEFFGTLGEAWAHYPNSIRIEEK
jgi:hypothetical protein